MLMISIKDIPKEEQHSHAHKLLRECLKKCGIAYEDGVTPLSYIGRGKPYLAEHPDKRFNLSHSDGIAACIVSGRECGIDCERIKPYRINVLRRILSEKEQKMFEDTPKSKRDLLFFRLWTLKESYIKAIGTGLTFPMSKAEFSFENGEILSNIGDHIFKQYILHDEFVVSVCISADFDKSKKV